MKFLRLATGFSLVVALAGPGQALAAATTGGSTSGTDSKSSGGGSAPAAGAVTVGTGAGQLEGNLLSALELNAAASGVCSVVSAKYPTGGDASIPLAIIPGTDRPDDSDWLVFKGRLAFVTEQYKVTERDFRARHAEFQKIHTETPDLPPTDDAAHGATFEKEVGDVLMGLGPTGAVMTGFTALTTVSAALSSSYDYGGAASTFSDYSLAVAVAGDLPGRFKVIIPSHASLTAAATAITAAIKVPDAWQNAVIKAGYSKTAQADIDALTVDAKVQGANKAQLGKLSAALKADMDNFATADASLLALKQSLYAPAAVTAPAATPAPAGADASTDTSGNNGKKGTPAAASAAASSPTLLATLLREKTVADLLDKAGQKVLYVKIELAWGGYYSQQNLFSYFGANPLHVSGGAVVNYALYDGDVLKKAALLPLGSDYIGITKVGGMTIDAAEASTCALPARPKSVK